VLNTGKNAYLCPHNKQNYYKMKRTIALLLLLSLILGIQAQQPMLRNFTASDYRGGTQNWCIDKTTDNRLLLANNNGLLEFDSQKWRLFPLPNYSNVRAILFDTNRKVVWAGGSGELGYYDMDNDQFLITFHSLTNRLTSQDKEFGEIWRIMAWKDFIVLQGRYHLFFVDKNDSLSSMTMPESITACAVVGDRLFWTTGSGLYQLKNGKPQQLPGTEVLKNYTIRTILNYNGQPVIATTHQGLFRYDGQEVKPFLQHLTPFLAENQLYCADLKGDKLAIGTVRKGLLLYDMVTGATQYANRETGLQNNTVLSLRFDEQQNIWLGLDQGLSYVMPGFPFSNLLAKNSPIGTGYATLITPSMLYLGSNQGIFAIPYPLKNDPVPPMPQLVGQLTGQTWELTEIDGTLFCGHDAGAYIIDGMKVHRIEGPDGTWHFVALRHHPGLILACDYSGFYLLRKQGSSYVFDGRLKGFKESCITFIEASDGSIWMGHWKKGVYRLELSPDGHGVVDTKLFNTANGLPVDDNNLVCEVKGQVYVSSVDGFHRYNAKTHRLEHADQMNKVFETYGTSLRIYETPQHDLWAYKPGYLAIAHPQKDGSYIVDSISYKNMERDLQMIFGHPTFTATGQTIMNSGNGYFLVDNQYKAQTHPQHLIMQSIMSTNNGEKILYASSPTPEDMIFKVKHSENSLRFSFVMPEYSRPNEIFYECFLEGYDKEWVALGHVGEKEYTKLPKGDYILHIKARNNMTGDTDERLINIQILPAWYETWWARLLALLLAIVVLWLINKWAKKKVNQRIALVQQENEREMQRQREKNELEMKAQQAQFAMEQHKREKEVVRLKNEQLETELKHRQSELGDSTMNLMRKNDMLQALDTQLEELSESVRREDVKSKITQKIKDIRHDIQNNINEDEGWDKFEENFNLVYDNFMKRLVDRFPDLKMNDRKLCAYLRMGLSSKEMASLLNTSVRSIETARYRLRKKLGMEQGDNLAEFIQSFGEVEDK